MENVLQLGAVFAFCDLFNEIKSAGYEPIVCDYYENAPCKRFSNISYDISTIDTDSLTEIARKHDVKGIAVAFSDRNLKPSMDIANRLGLPTLYTTDIISKITNKINMKEKLQEARIPIIPYRVLENGFADKELDGMNFPLLIKPVDGYGSKGIVICNSINDIKSNFEKTVSASKDFKTVILAEEENTSDELSIAGWVKGGKVYLTCVYDVLKQRGSTITKKIGSIFPSKYLNGTYTKEFFQLLAQKVVNAFGIKQGPITLQCFINDNDIRVSELLYRFSGGGSYFHTVVMGGPNLAKMMIQFWTNTAIDTQNLEDFSIESPYFTYYMFRMLVHSANELKFQFEINNVKKLMPEICNYSVYRNEEGKYSLPLAEGEVIMRFYCKLPKGTGKSFNSIVKEANEKFVITNASGEKISFFRYLDKDFFP
ncbi:MAG: ATP-grasp domain-containing protein [Lachnospiraceae bacterium]|jgi:biotin carboxylase|nr:ATP-grasp domain-containing protein [Lachnospiraceae bacterium]